MCSSDLTDAYRILGSSLGRGSRKDAGKRDNLGGHRRDSRTVEPVTAHHRRMERGICGDGDAVAGEEEPAERRDQGRELRDRDSNPNFRSQNPASYH